MEFIKANIFAIAAVPSIFFAIYAYFACMKGYNKSLGMHRRIRSSVKRHVTHHIFGWALMFCLLWMFITSILALMQGRERIPLIFLVPLFFGLGEFFGLFMWRMELRRVTHPRQLEKIRERNRQARKPLLPAFGKKPSTTPPPPEPPAGPSASS